MILSDQCVITACLGKTKQLLAIKIMFG